MSKVAVAVLLIAAVFASGCAGSGGLNINLFCTPNWEKQGVFVLDDAAGHENCRSYCQNKYQSDYKIEKEGVGAACYCDINRC